MKQIITSLLVFSSITLFSQRVNFKKNKVFFDKKEILDYEIGGTFGATNYDLYEIEPHKRIIVLIDNNGGTPREHLDDYVQIKFITSGTNADVRGNIIDAIKLLVKNEVITENGKLDESKIELFVKNYDENISNRTIISR
ncbi:hypothetical protein H1R16_10755 [Marnyiella aurantia]|uniref:Uncharacterized protein n=1 Tax=Marnyiella aurantia TaxID=2758037 RepID=A0A7D7QXR5_9FLAO|nr:hypothetical protein [Marnyiella aurantia]MBA5246468.1 hypothetical protein [Marnyiella aurantia]QMS98166.1 hypothetical protein H1R16_10755 [Marnyiella aurantia]